MASVAEAGQFRGNSRRLIVRAAVLGLAGAVVTALAVGLPTDIVPNPVFGRQEPVRPQDYVFLALTALLTGLLTASYAFPKAAHCPLPERRIVGGGVLSFLAVGCPVCNKAVVLLLGTSGALTYFEPVQPILGIASLGLLATALWFRWRPILSHAAGERPG